MYKSKLFTRLASQTLLGVFIALGFFVFGSTAGAIGQLTEPIVVENALRGYEFEEILTVLNTDYTDTDVSFSTEGDIEGWASFYDPSDKETEIESVLIPARDNKEIIARFKVPDDAPNGEYAGLVNAQIDPGDDATSSEKTAKLIQQISRQVTITVTDQEEINVDVSIIPEEYEIPSGEPFQVKIIYDNWGNVIVKPQVGIKLVQKIDDKEIVYYNVIYPYPENLAGAKPLEPRELPIFSIPISEDIEKGRVRAQFTFTINGEEIYSDTIAFTTGLVKPGENEKRGGEKELATLDMLYLLFGGLFVIMFVIVMGIIWFKKGKGKTGKTGNKGTGNGKNGVRKTNGNGKRVISKTGKTSNNGKKAINNKGKNGKK